MPRTVKMSDEMVNIAENETLISGRSLAGQMEHWAKIGRAIEQSPAFNYERIKAALNAQIAYDDLTSEEQEVYLEEIDELSWSDPDAKEKAFFAQLTGPGLDENGEVVYLSDQS